MDTAEMYPVPLRPEYVGASEEIAGRWLADRGCRDDFIIASKVRPRSGKCDAGDPELSMPHQDTAQ